LVSLNIEVFFHVGIGLDQIGKLFTDITTIGNLQKLTINIAFSFDKSHPFGSSSIVTLLQKTHRLYYLLLKFGVGTIDRVDNIIDAIGAMESLQMVGIPFYNGNGTQTTNHLSAIEEQESSIKAVPLITPKFDKLLGLRVVHIDLFRITLDWKPIIPLLKSLECLDNIEVFQISLPNADYLGLAEYNKITTKIFEVIGASLRNLRWLDIFSNNQNDTVIVQNIIPLIKRLTRLNSFCYFAPYFFSDKVRTLVEEYKPALSRRASND
jgi:hypothetical protein